MGKLEFTTDISDIIQAQIDKNNEAKIDRTEIPVPEKVKDRLEYHENASTKRGQIATEKIVAKAKAAGEASNDGIWNALYEIQKEIQYPRKDATNPHFNSKYTTLLELVKHLKPYLQKHNILMTMHYVNGEKAEHPATAILTLRHMPTGEFVTSSMNLLMERNSNHALGSACTYSTRYMLESLFMLPGIDDDGNAASSPEPTSNRAPYDPPKITAAIPKAFENLSRPEDLIAMIDSRLREEKIEENPDQWIERSKGVEACIKANSWEGSDIIQERWIPLRTTISLISEAKELFG